MTAGTAPPSGRILWLLAGAATGALATAGVALAVTAFLSPDPPANASGPPRFVEVPEAGGIDHVYDGEFPFFVGGGVAVFDCDTDGRPDLYFAGGANPASLHRNDSAAGGALRFARLRDPTTDLTGVTGAYPIDIDGDGAIDLAVLRLGENVLLRGAGDCRFARANERWNVDGGDDWTAAFSATWESSGRLPTLAFGNYLADNGRQTGECADHVLFRPDGSGVYGDPLTLQPGWCTLSILFSDWSRSGQRDLRMTNDRHYYRDGEEQLWRMVPDAPPRPYTAEEGWQTMQIWGMGIASQDLTGDGRPEVFLTSQGDNKLQSLDTAAPDPRYGDIAFERGATAHRPFAGDTVKPSTGWHAEFQDVNNDGYTDLFVAKGNVEAMAEYAVDDPNNLLIGGSDGGFTEGAADAGIVSFARSRGAALADFDLDGMLDLVVVNRREPVQVWKNVGRGDAETPAPTGRWVDIRLEQDGANRDAIGAWVEVKVGDRTTERELTVGGGHAGGQLGWMHFGLGEAPDAEVRVQWPDGEHEPWATVEAGERVIIERGAAEPRRWSPPTR